MKKRIRILAIAIIMMLLLPQVACNCNGCNKEEYVVMGNFLCLADGAFCEVMGLSEEGKQQEVIVVPDILEGKKVFSVGKKNFLGGSIGEFESEKLKTLYMPFDYDIYCDFSKCINLENVFIIGTTNNHGSYYDVNDEEKKILTIYDVANTNIKFVCNYKNDDDYFWIDKKESGEKLDKPLIEPERERYIFDGWYKDKECTEKWDFENDVMPEIEYTGYSPTQSLYLYAKWIRM